MIRPPNIDEVFCTARKFIIVVRHIAREISPIAIASLQRTGQTRRQTFLPETTIAHAVPNLRGAPPLSEALKTPR